MTKQGALVDAAWERGAHWERLRIRRAQREALDSLRTYAAAIALPARPEVYSALIGYVARLTNATRAPRGKGRKT